MQKPTITVKQFLSLTNASFLVIDASDTKWNRPFGVFDKDTVPKVVSEMLVKKIRFQEVNDPWKKRIIIAQKQ